MEKQMMNIKSMVTLSSSLFAIIGLAACGSHGFSLFSYQSLTVAEGKTRPGTAILFSSKAARLPSRETVLRSVTICAM